MPFLPVASKGGPWDDDAFVAGYQMGLLDARLELGHLPESLTIYTGNREQADLIAMRHGYTVVFTQEPDWPEWTHMQVTGSGHPEETP
jgi:hypothetical protein